jgi:hypothetical protein
MGAPWREGRALGSWGDPRPWTHTHIWWRGWGGRQSRCHSSSPLRQGAQCIATQVERAPTSRWTGRTDAGMRRPLRFACPMFPRSHACPFPAGSHDNSYLGPQLPTRTAAQPPVGGARALVRAFVDRGWDRRSIPPSSPARNGAHPEVRPSSSNGQATAYTPGRRRRRHCHRSLAIAAYRPPRATLGGMRLLTGEAEDHSREAPMLSVRVATGPQIWIALVPPRCLAPAKHGRTTAGKDAPASRVGARAPPAQPAVGEAGQRGCRAVAVSGGSPVLGATHPPHRTPHASRPLPNQRTPCCKRANCPPRRHFRIPSSPAPRNRIPMCYHATEPTVI